MSIVRKTWNFGRLSAAAAGLVCVLALDAGANDGAINTPATGTTWVADNSIAGSTYQTQTTVASSDGVRYVSRTTTPTGQSFLVETAYGFFNTRAETQSPDGQQIVAAVEIDETIAASLFPLTEGKRVDVPLVITVSIDGIVQANLNGTGAVRIGAPTTYSIGGTAYDAFEAEVEMIIGGAPSGQVADVVFATDLGVPVRLVQETPNGPLTIEVVQVTMPGGGAGTAASQ